MFIPLLLTLPAAVPAARGRTLSQHSLVPVAVAYPARGRAPGYRQVFGDRLFRRVWVLTALVVAVGYGQLHAGFPAYAAGPGGISANALGFAFAANMVVVVAAQLPVLRLVAGRRRTRVLCLACATWAGAYSLTLLGGHLGGGSLAVGGFVAAMAVFALAETLVSPTLPAIVNDIATEELQRGR